VLIHDDIKKRNHWKMGVVKELYPGKDGIVREVSLRTSFGNDFVRPIEKLYPLEILEEDDEGKHTKDEGTEKPTRPHRLAAQRAMERIKDQSSV